ncbi:hypothetical protein ACIQVR_41835 [Streptomyces xanthochromogenes]|uniref:hypothetical protein n=1 Tax=Streptomyces xanthochromogenes TaxID=67384 RepID=UPI0038112C26
MTAFNDILAGLRAAPAVSDATPEELLAALRDDVLRVAVAKQRAAQDAREDAEKAEHGSLDYESVLQGDAVRASADLIDPDVNAGGAR